jgi:glutathione S-transferase
MPRYISIEEAKRVGGLRMVCLRGVPSPWGEAARGIFHVKGLDCQYAARSDDEPENALAAWAGDSSVPVVAWEREQPRTGWAEILVLAERLAPQPALVPADADARVELFGLAHEICGEMGLGWCLRLLMLQSSLGHGEQGAAIPAEQAARLGAKYGLIPAHIRQAKGRVLAVLDVLDRRLQRGPFLVGEALTAADIYWAVFANFIRPLPEDLLPLAASLRAMCTQQDADIVGAFSGRLADHQREIYQRHLELPVPL